jgi:hypothetical protein
MPEDSWCARHHAAHHGVADGPDPALLCDFPVSTMRTRNRETVKLGVEATDCLVQHHVTWGDGARPLLEGARFSRRAGRGGAAGSWAEGQSASSSRRASPGQRVMPMSRSSVIALVRCSSALGQLPARRASAPSPGSSGRRADAAPQLPVAPCGRSLTAPAQRASCRRRTGEGRADGRGATSRRCRDQAHGRGCWGRLPKVRGVNMSYASCSPAIGPGSATERRAQRERSAHRRSTPGC